MHRRDKKDMAAITKGEIHMKKRIGLGVFAVLLAVSMLIGLSACGGAAVNKDEEYYQGAMTTTVAATATYGYTKPGSEEVSYDGDKESGQGSAPNDTGILISQYSDILAERKVIFSGNISVEVENFVEAFGKIKSFLVGIGYVQSVDITKDKIEIDGEEVYISRGVIVIRVARDQFDAAMANIGEAGFVLDQKVYSNDVTDQFFDIEARLKLLRIEEDRLLSYLEDIKDPETIFKYEARLTQIRTEIESLTGTLNKLSDLISLSTITINMREIEPETEEKPAEGFFPRLGAGFVKSVKAVVRFLGSFVIFLAGAIPVILVIAAFAAIVILIVFGVRRTVKRRNMKKKNDGQ